MNNKVKLITNFPEIKFVFPDPLTNPEMLSGALFLYFDDPIWVSMPPIIMIPDSFEILELIKNRKPDWGEIFLRIYGSWRRQMDGFHNTMEALKSLKDKSLKTMYISYPATVRALEESENLATASGLKIENIFELINPINASSEIIRHIMGEQFLQLNSNINELFKYCNYLFEEVDIKKLLTKAYLFRLQMLPSIKGSSILLTNQKLTILLEKLPIDIENNQSKNIDFDVIAWELFRQILSPRLDPLNAESSDYICSLIESRKNEIVRLRSKCYKLAEKIENIKSIDELITKVEKLIKLDVENEIANLFELDKDKVKKYLSELFSDKTTWIGMATTILGIVTGQPSIAVGGAIVALSNIGAEAISQATKRNERIRQSDYAIVYRIGTH